MHTGSVAALNVRHVFAAVVAVTHMHTKLALVLLLIWTSALVELQTNETSIGQLRRAIFGKTIQHLLDGLPLWVSLVILILAFVWTTSCRFVCRRLLRLVRACRSN